MKERKMDWRGHIEPPYETHVTLWKKKKVARVPKASNMTSIKAWRMAHTPPKSTILPHALVHDIHAPSTFLFFL
jgi:hypothetical protein